MLYNNATIACGGVVGWSSKYQFFVILFSTEVEYVAAVKARKEIKWMRNILTEFEYSFLHTSTLFINKKSVIEVIKNTEHHKCMKHLDL